MAEQRLHVPVAHRLVHDLPYSRPTTPARQGPVQVGWIGLGAMGYLMARNLANHRATHLENQPPLLVWNRSKEKSEKLLNELGGGHKVAIAQSVADVATKCDIIISSLASDNVVKSIFKDIVASLQARSLYVLSKPCERALKAKHRHNLQRSTKYL
jgi:3-hydroxyisobutyrate dehydrogenase-like beta-hydroxyacid dehydrogenase